MRTSAQKRARATYDTTHLDHINVWVRKGGHARWKEYARQSGKSFRRFVFEAIEEKAAREGLAAGSDDAAEEKSSP